MVSTILLVEDNPSDIQLAQRALEKEQVRARLVVARDGQEALDMLFGDTAVGTVEPALILLDLRLPRVDGLTLLKQIKSDERTRKWPVVILTTSGEEQDVQTAYQFGANSYIRKPVDFSEFSRTVAQVSAYWLVLNQQPNNSRTH